MNYSGRAGQIAGVLLGICLFLVSAADVYADVLTLSGGLKIVAEKSRVIR